MVEREGFTSLVCRVRRRSAHRARDASPKGNVDSQSNLVLIVVDISEISA